jgi:hypothetical protein
MGVTASWPGDLIQPVLTGLDPLLSLGRARRMMKSPHAAHRGTERIASQYQALKPSRSELCEDSAQITTGSTPIGGSRALRQELSDPRDAPCPIDPAESVVTAGLSLVLGPSDPLRTCWRWRLSKSMSGVTRSDSSAPGSKPHS